MSSLMFSFLKIIPNGIYRVNNYTLNESLISIKIWCGERPENLNKAVNKLLLTPGWVRLLTSFEYVSI